MNGRDILKELSFIDTGYIEAAAPLPVEKGNDGFKQIVLAVQCRNFRIGCQIECRKTIGITF